ncbi:hypothetical protein ACFORH_20355 [Amycolatopsis roodepoortensis]|uniref:Cell pole-organizing protein PopZ n=2 Tax=Amycolatopsis roodepoortensis TaxID=700274 RepID=A0ABR9LDQ7_9PSEU|nr:hypothetical protein [Amycolatopsis roodepoortensis]MBE1578825.1 cell pole-organizing protein PopZ [Amycolatopsis roodepoortensis]
MTAWWGLTGLLGLLGTYGLVRIRHRADVQSEAPAADAFARYPAAREPAVPNADTAHTPLMTPAITPEMIGGAGRRRASRPARVRAHRQPRTTASQPNQGGTQAVAEPVTDPGTVPVQAGPPEPETPPTVALPGQRPAEEGTIAGELTPDRSDREDAAEETQAEPPEISKPEPAKLAEAAAKTPNRSRPRRVLEVVVRQAKKAKGILHRN